MLSRVILVSCMLILIINLAIFAEQSTEEKLKDIDLAIERYEEMKIIGIIACMTGLLIELADLPLALLTGLQEASGTKGSLDARNWNIGLAVGGAAVIGIGGFLWIFSASNIKLYEKQKKSISLQLTGPGLTLGSKLGGISLAYSY